MKGAAPVAATRWIATTSNASAADCTTAGVRAKPRTLPSYQDFGMKMRCRSGHQDEEKRGRGVVERETEVGDLA